MDKRLKAKAGIARRIVVMAILAAVFAAGSAAVAQEPAGAASEAPDSARTLGLFAAAAAFGLGAIGAGIAIAHVGSAAMGAVGEKPEVGGQALIFVALAEGVVVFGFIIALMILGKV
ncbi:MAG: ATPase [Spirochaetia bacterium]|nr:ATPase [Spirochaetia bacterium]